MILTLPVNKEASSGDDETRLLVTVTDGATHVAEDFVVVNTVDGPRCISAVCPHSGGPLCDGDIEDMRIVCPWHAFRFSLDSGQDEDMGSHAARVIGVQEVDGGDEGWIRCRLLLEAHETVSAVVPKRMVRLVRRTDAAVDTAREPRDIVVDADSGSTSANTLVDWCIRILNETEPSKKVELTLECFKRFKDGDIKEIHGNAPPPRQPGRQQELVTVTASQSKKIGKGGTLGSRIAILHSLANVEQWAIDLAVDIIARFHTFQASAESPTSLPYEFFMDFLKVAADEAKHFTYLSDRLRELGSRFGALPVHGGLWESAEDTKDDLLARLAIVHMVHEARGLDVNPGTIAKFQKADDDASVALLSMIHDDEVSHVATGQKWFSHICGQRGLDKYVLFHGLVRRHFRGRLKPPFNIDDRMRAGMDERFYLPLV